MAQSNTNFVFLLLIVFFGSFFSSSMAQKRTTVVANSETNNNNVLDFNLKQLPVNAHFDENSFKLTLNIADKILSNRDSEICYVYKYPFLKDVPNTALGASEQIDKNTRFLNIALDLKTELDKKETNIQLETSFTNSGKIFFCTSDVNSVKYEVNKQPKLIVNYEITEEPKYSSWEQINSNAQNTNAISWSWSGELTAASLIARDFKLVKGVYDKTIMYRERPIVFEQVNETTCQMSLLNAKNNSKMWNVDLESAPSVVPLITKNGFMYLFLKNKTFKRINLENRSKIESVPLSEFSFKNNGSEIKIEDVDGDPKIGYDGTVYLKIKNQSRVGIVALKIDSKLKSKPRWFYNTTNPISNVALSDNEELAFFIETETKTDSIKNRSKLVVLNNINGSVLATSNFILSSFTNDNNSYFSKVMVQKINSQKSNIYVLDGNDVARKLFVFQIDNNAATALDLEKKTLNPAITIQSDIQSGISQPVATAIGKVYFIKDERLWQFDSKTSTAKKLDNITNSFSNNSAITATASGQLFIDSDAELYYVDLQKNSPIVVSTPGMNQKSDRNLLISPSLGAYLISSDNSKFFNLGMTNGLSQLRSFEDNVVYHNYEVVIEKDAVFEPKMTAIVVAKKIKLNKGITIRKGVSIKFKTN